MIMSSSFRLVYWIGLWSHWLGLALSPSSTSVSSDFMVLCKCYKNILTSLYLVEGLVWWDWPLPGGLTNCCPSVLDTVGWVIWPLKIVPDMTYNVFGGTLNPTLLLYYSTRHCMNYRACRPGSRSQQDDHVIRCMWIKTGLDRCSRYS